VDVVLGFAGVEENEDEYENDEEDNNHPPGLHNCLFRQIDSSLPQCQTESASDCGGTNYNGRRSFNHVPIIMKEQFTRERPMLFGIIRCSRTP
jgi:hypothetical protein